MKVKTLLIASLTTTLLLSLSACAPQPAQQKEPYGSVTIDDTMTKTTSSSQQLAPPAAGDTVAVIETDMGTIKFKLFTEQVPEMTKNFIELAKAGKFDNVPFHRVIKNFMIQTGDFTKKNGTGGYSYKGPGTELPDEFAGLKHLYGTVSMANSGANTNGSQFYIVTRKNGTPDLDGGYTIFGQVYEGMDVAEKIADLFIPSSGGAGTPSKIINMTKVTVMPYAP
jgi:peptidyl-prolyl cis-trans isomerase B (cyclophilin B)